MVFGPSEYIAILALVISVGTAVLSFWQGKRIAQDAGQSAAIATRRGHLTELLRQLLEIETEWTVVCGKQLNSSMQNTDMLKEAIPKKIPSNRAALTVDGAAILRRVNGLYRAYHSHFELTDREYLQTRHSISEPLSNNQQALEFAKELQSTTQKALEKLNY